MRIGFVGLGNMGAPMARNLLKGGHTLRVYDVVADNVAQLAADGAAVAASARDAAVQAEMLITMLPSSPHVRAVYLGEDGVIAGAGAGTTLIDSSTIDPHTAREVAAAAAARARSSALSLLTVAVPCRLM